jgi:hypothetical protein
MKTKLFMIGSILFCGIFKGSAQATIASNTISATDYIGSSNNFPILFKVNNIQVGKISTSYVNLGQNSNSGTNSISIGGSAGQYATSGNSVYLGNGSGQGTSTTANTGDFNSFVGYSSGYKNSTGAYNVFFGNNCGVNTTTGSYNTFIGERSGYTNQTGTNNVFLGRQSGYSNTGSSNVFLGYQAGYFETGSDKLYIDNSNTATPLVWGDFANDQVKLNGKVGIGAVTTFPTTAGGVSVSTYKLFVSGGILTEEVRVSAVGTWADYVFKKNYNLKPLSEVETFIKENGHLPNVPSAAQVESEGIALGEMSKIQQEKIEELTLYIIDQNKEIEKLKTQVKEIDELKKLVTELINKK